MAALNGHLETVRLLLAAGVEKDKASTAGATPLHLAALNGHPDVARVSGWFQMGVSKNRGGPPKSSILTGFSIINHPFWGTPIFGNTQIYFLFSSRKLGKIPILTR